MTVELDDERARREFRSEKYLSLWIDFPVHPTFWDREGAAVDFDMVPVSAAVIERFVRWYHWGQNRLYKPSLRDPDPPFPDLADFVAEGRAIAEAIKRELPDWRIVYHDQEAQRAVAIEFTDRS